ncbi:MAG: TorF family putative porin [Pseudomonadota bacterium]
MKRNLVSLSLLWSFGHFSAVWAEEAPLPLTGSAALVSDYKFRGVSQTDRNPAVQAGLTYTHSSGLYAGVWGSNVNFQDGNEANLELDLKAGYTQTIDKLSYDLWVVGYFYPGATHDLHYDFMEVGGKLGYDLGVVKLAGSLNYSPEYFGKTGAAWYYLLEAAVPLPMNFDIHGHYGVSDFDRKFLDDYGDWALGIKKSIGTFDINLDYMDTTGVAHKTNWTDGRLILSLAKNF